MLSHRIRSLAIVAGATAALTLPTGAAFAAPGTGCPPGGDGGSYPGQSCAAEVNVSVVTPGASVTVHVYGYQPRSHFVVVVHSAPRTIGQGTMSGSGEVTDTVQIPSDLKPGHHTLLVRGTDASGGPRVMSAGFTVRATAANRAATSIGGTGAALPSTGSPSNMLPLVGTGAGLVIVGAGAVAVSRRRRPQA